MYEQTIERAEAAEASAEELMWAEVAARSAEGSLMRTEDQHLQEHFDRGGFVEVHTPRDSSVTTRQQSKVHHRKLVMEGDDYGVILGGEFVSLTSGRHSWIEMPKLEI